MCGARRLHDLFGRGVEAPVSKVVGNRAGKEHGILEDDGDVLAERGDIVLPDIEAVDQDAAGGRVVEPGNQADERRLAGAGQPDECDHFAGVRVECDVVQDVGAVGVLEPHVLKP